jgi:hypothetical protein
MQIHTPFAICATAPLLAAYAQKQFCLSMRQRGPTLIFA